MFDEIIICMDSDEAGHKATQEALKVLPENKVKVMLLSGKDCSDMLQEGKQKQFISNFYDAKPLIETGIKSVLEASKEIADYLLAEKITLPPQLHKLQTAMRGGIRQVLRYKLRTASKRVNSDFRLFNDYNRITKVRDLTEIFYLNV